MSLSTRSPSRQLTRRSPRSITGPSPVGWSATRDVRALARVAVAARLVSAAVTHATDRLDAEVGVPQRPVAGQLRGAALDVEAVVSGENGDVAFEEAVVVRLVYQERVLPAPTDPISADDVAGASDWGILEPEVDACPPRAPDDISGDHVAAPLFDGYGGPVAEGTVSGDHVSAAGADVDGGTVSSEAVASHPIAVRFHEDSEVGVA